MAALTLYGPDKQGIIYRHDSSNIKTPVFVVSTQSSKPQLRLARILPNGLHQPLGTAASSSFSGTTTIVLHGEELKMRLKSESLQYWNTVTLPDGQEMRWKSDKWGTGKDLEDSARVKVAHYGRCKLFGDARMEIFVPASDWLVEFIVVSATALSGEDRRGLEMAGNILGAVTG